MTALIGTTADWYLMRASGFVALALLTVSVCLGVANLGRLAGRGWTRTVAALVHRNVALLAVVFLAVHIVTAVSDRYAGAGLVSVVVPGTSSYDPLWVGLGAVSLDLMVAVVVTSLLRSRLPAVLWRVVHWAAYLCWPVAVMHGVGSGTGTGVDTYRGWAIALYAVLAAVFAGAVALRLRFRSTPARLRTPLAAPARRPAAYAVAPIGGDRLAPTRLPLDTRSLT